MLFQYSSIIVGISASLGLLISFLEAVKFEPEWKKTRIIDRLLPFTGKGVLILTAAMITGKGVFLLSGSPDYPEWVDSGVMDWAAIAGGWIAVLLLSRANLRQSIRTADQYFPVLLWITCTSVAATLFDPCCMWSGDPDPGSLGLSIPILPIMTCTFIFILFLGMDYTARRNEWVGWRIFAGTAAASLASPLIAVVTSQRFDPLLDLRWVAHAVLFIVGLTGVFAFPSAMLQSWMRE